ncbi:3437_t:CDS:1, partial [Racocetra persica]
IDDNPNVCRSLICRDCLEVKSDGEIALAPVECGKCPEMTVIAPYYPAVASQHDERVLLVKNEVSELKKEDFEQMKKLTAINEQKQEVDFGFAGKYRTQTNTSLSWN